MTSAGVSHAGLCTLPAGWFGSHRTIDRIATARGHPHLRPPDPQLLTITFDFVWAYTGCLTVGLVPAAHLATIRGRAAMTFSAVIHHEGGTDMRLDVTGQVMGRAAIDLQVLITKVINGEQPDALVVNLQGVIGLCGSGLHALIAGYLAAIDQGTSYSVVHAQGQARHVLQATGTMEMLTDSNDLGALLLAVLAHPVTNTPSPREPS